MEKEIADNSESLLQYLKSAPKAFNPNTDIGFSSSNTPLGGQGESQYDAPLSPFTVDDVQENRERSQGTLDKWSNALPRLVSKTGTELFKIPSFLGGSVGFISSGDYSPKNFTDFVNNSFVQGADNFDQSIKDQYPIYTPKAIREGNLMEQIKNPDFWVTEGVDGAGFLAAAWASGGLLGSLGIGSKIAKLAGNINTAKNIDLGISTGVNTVYESLSEAQGLTQELKQSFAVKMDPKSPQYDPINKDTGKPWTQEEIDAAIGKAGEKSFLINMALLIAPNYIMNKNLLGKFSLEKSAIEKVTDAAGNILENIPKATRKEMAAQYLKEIGKSTISEGFVEEGGQFAVEKYLQNSALQKTDKGYIDGIAEAYNNAFSDIEGQKSIFLGGVLGTLGGTVGEYRKNKQEHKHLERLRSLLDNTVSSYTEGLTDLYKKEDGKVVLNSEGKPVLDVDKVKASIENFGKLETRNSLKNMYAILGNEEGFNFVRNEDFNDFAYSFLKEEGGIDVLNKQIDNLAPKLLEELSLVDKAKTEIELKTELKERARKLQQIHDKTALYNSEHTDLKTPKKEDQNLLNMYANKIAYTMYNEYSRQEYFKEQILKLNAESFALRNADNDIDKAKLKTVDAQLKDYQEAYINSQKAYKDLINTKKQQELFDINLKSLREEQQKRAEENKDIQDTEPTQTEEEKTKEDLETEDHKEQKKEENEPEGSDIVTNPFEFPEDDVDFSSIPETPDDYPEFDDTGFDDVDVADFPDDGPSPQSMGLDPTVTIIQGFDEARSTEDIDKVVQEAKEKNIPLNEEKVQQKKEALETKDESSTGHRGAEDFNRLFIPGSFQQRLDGQKLVTEILNTVSDIRDAELEMSIIPAQNRTVGIQKNSKGVLYNSTPYDIKVTLNGHLIGYYPYYGRFVIQGKEVNPLLITPEQYIQELGANPNQSLVDFQNAYTANKAFFDYIEKRIKDKSSIVLSKESINELFDLVITPGSLDFKVTDLQDLEHLLFKDTEGQPLILRRKKITIKNEAGEDILVSDTPISFYNNLTEDGVTKPEYIQALEYLESKKNFDSSFVALVKDKSGEVQIGTDTYTWIPLYSANKENDTNDFFNKINDFKESIKDIQDTPQAERNTKVDAFNKELNKDLFIANKKGVLIKLEVTPYGTFKFDFLDKTTKEKKHFYIKSSTKTFKELLQKANEVIKADKINARDLKESDFRVLVQDNSTENLIENLYSGVSENIRKNKSLLMNFKNKTQEVAQPVLENPVQEIQVADDNIDVQKADIERRRQEELKDLSSDYYTMLDEVNRTGELKEFNPLGLFGSSEDIKAYINDKIKSSLNGERARKINAKYDAELGALKDNISNKTPQITSTQSLEERKAKASDPIDSSDPSVFKISKTPANNLIDLHAAKAYIRSIFGDSAVVKDLDILFTNLENNGITWGAVKNSTIYLSKSAEKGTEFHEAFHLAFRNFLSEQGIRDLLTQAKSEIKQKDLDSRIQELKEIKDYKDLTDKQLEELALEEYLADKFEDFKKGKAPKSTFLGRFFQKILDWAKNLFSNSDIDAFFYKIDSGAFKNSPKINNTRFSNQMVYKNIPTEVVKIEGKNVTKFLSSDRSTQIVNTVSALTYEKLEANPKLTFEKAVEQVLDDQYNFFDYTKYPELTPAQQENFFQNQLAFTKRSSGTQPRDIIAQQVYNNLASFKDIKTEDNETTDGISKDRAFDLDKDQVGGFTSLTGTLRRYLALTTYIDTKNFGVPVTVAVNPNKVYSGIAKYLSNTLDEHTLILKLNDYAKISEESSYVINKFFSPDRGVGLVLSEDLDTFEYNKEKSQLFHSFTKELNLGFKNNLFLGVDQNQGFHKLSNANQQGVDKEQVNRWKLNFFEYQTDPIKAGDAILEIRNALAEKGKKNKNQMEVLISTLQSKFLSTGIELSRGYIKHLILSNSERESTKDQKVFIETNSNLVNNSYEYVLESLEQISKTFKEGNNPFSVDTKIEQDENGNYIEKEGDDKANIGRLKNIARDNAMFDETITPGNYVDASNKTRYALQKMSYNFVRALQLRTEANDYTSIEDKWKQDNLLHLSEDFQDIKKNLIVYGADGQRDLILGFSENSGEYEEKTQKVKKEGVTFGDFTDRDFLIYAYGLYANQVKTVKKGKDIISSPMITTIMEASNTLDLVYLPVIDAWNSGFTEDFKDKLFNEVKREHARIQDVKAGLYKDRIENFNAGSKRGSKFWVFKDLLSSDLQSQLIDASETALEGFKPRIIQELVDSLTKEFEAHIQLLIQEKILSEDEGVLRNQLLDKRYHNQEIKGQTNLKNQSKHLKDNLAQAYFSNWLNNLAYSGLTIGDPALSLKDSLDYFKRARGLNASGSNIYSRDFQSTPFIITGSLNSETDKFEDPDLDTEYVYYTENTPGVPSRLLDPKNPIDKEIIKKNNLKPTKKLDTSDAQGLANIDFFINTYKSLGKLTPELEKVFNRIKEGKEFRVQDFKTLKDNHVFLNSNKLVYNDGKTYIKFSVALLTLQEVGIKVDGKWEAKPGFEYKFNLLNNMSTHGFMLSFPPSASKNLTKNVTQITETNQEVKENSVQTLDNRYFRLQMENPSNKTQGLDPTQMQQIIDSEQNLDLEMFFDGKKQSIKEIAEYYRSNNAQKSKALGIPYFNYLFKVQKGEYTPQLGRFQKRALKTLTETGASDQLLEFFRVDENNKPLYNLNLSTALPTFTRLFNAHFDTIFKAKTPGYKVTLESDFQHPIYEYNGKILPQSVYQSDPKFYNAEYKAGRLTTRRLEFNKERFDSKGNFIGTYSEVILPLHFIEQFGLKVGEEIPEDIAYMFGVRIPTQDKHSGMALKIVDTMPAYKGSNAIFPKELILLTGSDFDIDSFYIHRPDHYYDSRTNTLKIHGNTEDSRFDQYLKSWSTNSLVQEIIKEYKKDDKLPSSENDVLQVLLNTDEDENFEKVLDSLLVKDALKELGLPSTEEEYLLYTKDKGELNIGVLNNNILNAKIALHTNKGIREIALTPISDKIIKEVGQELALLLGFKSFNDMESKYSVSGLQGLALAFSSNKAGSKSIGSSVYSTQIYNFLTKYKADLKEGVYTPLFDSKTYNTFSNSTTEDGTRIMEVLSALTSAMTDNGKNGYVRRLNLTIEALGVVSYLTSLGVNLSTGIKLINTEYISKYLKESLKQNIVNDNQDSTSKYTAFAKLERELVLKIQEFDSAEEKTQIPEHPGEIKTKDLEVSLKGQRAEKTKEYYLNELNYLRNFRTFQETANSFFDIGNLIRLNKGVEAEFENGDKIEDSILKVQKESFPIDTKGAFENHKLVQKNLEIFKAYRKASESAFVERVPLFQSIKKLVLNSLKERLTNPTSTKRDLIKSLYSYLSTNAYYKLLSDNGVQLGNKNKYSTIGAAKEEEFTNLLEQNLELKKNIPGFENNPFIKLLRHNVKEGVLYINFDTRTKTNPIFQNRIIDGIDELFRNPGTKDYIKNLFYYLASKDALLFKNNSFLSVLPSYMFNPVSQGLDNSLNLLKKGQDSSLISEYIKVFGKDQSTLLKEFLEIYLRSKPNSYNLVYKKHIKTAPGITAGETSLVFDTRKGLDNAYVKKGLENLKEGSNIKVDFNIKGESITSSGTITKLRDLGDVLEVNIRSSKDKEYKNWVIDKSTGELLQRSDEGITPIPDAVLHYSELSPEIKESNDKIRKENHTELQKIFTPVFNGTFLEYNFPFVIKTQDQVFVLQKVDNKDPKITDNNYRGTKAEYSSTFLMNSSFGKSIQENEEAENPEYKKYSIKDIKYDKRQRFSDATSNEVPDFVGQNSPDYTSVPGYLNFKPNPALQKADVSTVPSQEEAKSTAKTIASVNPYDTDITSDFETKIKNPFEISDDEAQDLLDNYTENEIATPGQLVEKKPQGVSVKQGVSELFKSNPELANSVYEALGFKQNSVEEFKGFWSRQQVESQKDKVFLFGDNTNDRTVTKYIPSMTQAVIRGLPNAIGIDTKKDRGNSASSYLTDNDFNWFKNHVDTQIKLAKNSGKTIVIPADGIGTGKAMLKEKAPKLFEYLQQELNKLKEQQITPQQKQQAQELYSQYLDTIKSNVILPTDRIVFGHPTIGKSYLKEKGDNSFITLDDDYANEVNAFVDANRGSETRQEYKGRKPKEYNEFMLNLYDRLKVQAKKEGKILFVSNTNILKERMSEFDKVITMPKDEFKKRFDKRGSTYGFEDWKSDIDNTVAKVNKKKVISTSGYLSDLFITPQQKQQAQQIYSQYLDTIFPDSKVVEMDNSLYISVLNQLEQENKIEKDCTGGNKLKAEKGLQTNFTKGGRWKLIKDLKGYPTHKEGGVDLTISKNGVSIKNGNTEFTAKHGLVIPKN